VMCGSEMQLMKLEREIMLDRTGISMIMLICGLTLEERKNTEPRELLHWKESDGD